MIQPVSNRNRWSALAAFAMAAAAISAPTPAQPEASHEAKPAANVVTAEIQAGIEAYIEEQTRLGGGFFDLPFGETTLRLRLVRVHTEYLANLGPGQHFACVDLVSIEGDVFDVDFFLAGDPGAMTVTETIVHKTNGQPHYLWEQDADGAWDRAPLQDATPALLGVIEGSDRFEFIYEATLPRLTGDARMWIPLPSSDKFQTVEVREVRVPGTQRILADERYGNQVLFLTLTAEDSGKQVMIRSDIRRLEKAVHADNTVEASAFLAPEQLVPANDEFRTIASSVLEGKKGDLVRARALYDHTIDRMKYMKHGDGFGRGDAVYACDAKTGNCTDFHSYFIALARASGIPARFAIGAAIPSERSDGGIGGYHCWAEFFAEGQWWPVDISEADKYSSLATYYFGHHPANRVELSRGRDLVVDPGPVSGPINYLAYPVLEVDGRPIAVKPRLSFRRPAP